LGLPPFRKESGNGGLVVDSKITNRIEGVQINLKRNNPLNIPKWCENLLSLYKENYNDLKKSNKG